MKKLVLTGLFIIAFSSMVNSQSLNESPNFMKYKGANSELIKSEKMVVFIGNSITEGWVNTHPDFFTDNNYVGRGIGGQTSPQLLLRFRRDVIDLNPVAVVINIGTNDIAENTGKYDAEFTLENIKSMAELAHANGIQVILSAVLPVGEYPWRKEIKNVPQQIDALNAAIKAYAQCKGFRYIDYNTPMRNDTGGLIEAYGYDGVHPNAKGYEVMEKIVKAVIGEVIL